MNIGFFGSSAIVLLSDGENTSSRLDPLAIAEVASSAGVRIHAVGVGTTEGTVVDIDGFSIATALDEELLKQVAEVTDGTLRAGERRRGAQGHLRVDRPRAQARRRSRREVTALFAAGGGLLLALGSVLSIVWFGRVI